MKKIAKLYPNEKVKKNGSKINTSYLNATNIMLYMYFRNGAR